MIDFEYVDVGELGESVRASVETRAEDDELPGAERKSVANMRIDDEGAKNDHVRAVPRRFEQRAATAPLHAALGAPEPPRPFGPQHVPRRGIAKLGDMREADVGKSA